MGPKGHTGATGIGLPGQKGDRGKYFLDIHQQHKTSEIHHFCNAIMNRHLSIRCCIFVICNNKIEIIE